VGIPRRPCFGFPHEIAAGECLAGGAHPVFSLDLFLLVELPLFFRPRPPPCLFAVDFSGPGSPKCSFRVKFKPIYPPLSTGLWSSPGGMVYRLCGGEMTRDIGLKVQWALPLLDVSRCYIFARHTSSYPDPHVQVRFRPEYFFYVLGSSLFDGTMHGNRRGSLMQLPVGARHAAAISLGTLQIMKRIQPPEVRDPFVTHTNGRSDNRAIIVSILLPQLMIHRGLGSSPWTV